MKFSIGNLGDGSMFINNPNNLKNFYIKHKNLQFVKHSTTFDSF